MNITLGEMEKRLAGIIGENDGISSGELVKICEKEFSWKKSTSYTMLKRLCDKKVCENAGGKVHSLMSKEDIAVENTETLVNEDFGGSLPRFLAAFAERKKLSEKEIDEIQAMIDEYKRSVNQ